MTAPTKVAEAGDLRYFFSPLCSVLSSCSVRRPIGFRPPPDRIPSAVRSDSVRRPIRFRPPSDDKC